MTDSQTAAAKARALPLSVYTFYKFIQISAPDVEALKSQIQI